MRAKILVANAAVLVLAAFFYYQYGPSFGRRAAWDTSAITATYVGMQLKEMDSDNVRLLVSYDVENHTNTDYRLTNGPQIAVMSRLRTNGSLNTQNDIGLISTAFLPARQRVRVTLQLSRAFHWPADDDAAFEDELKDLINQQLADVDAFLLFDQSDRCVIEFPRGWETFQSASLKTASVPE